MQKQFFKPFQNSRLEDSPHLHRYAAESCLDSTTNGRDRATPLCGICVHQHTATKASPSYCRYRPWVSAADPCLPDRIPWAWTWRCHAVPPAKVSHEHDRAIGLDSGVFSGDFLAECDLVRGWLAGRHAGSGLAEPSDAHDDHAFGLGFRSGWGSIADLYLGNDGSDAFSCCF